MEFSGLRAGRGESPEGLVCPCHAGQANARHGPQAQLTLEKVETKPKMKREHGGGRYISTVSPIYIEENRAFMFTMNNDRIYLERSELVHQWGDVATKSAYHTGSSSKARVRNVRPLRAPVRSVFVPVVTWGAPDYV